MRSLARLWPYVRPVRGTLLVAALAAVLASCFGLVIPLALKWIVDGPVADRDPPGVWLGGLVVALLGVAEAGLAGVRRVVLAGPLAGVEAEMRSAFYRRLQRLPVSFHDRWPSGQLLSRATADLMLVRVFLAFPLTFLLVNGVTIVMGFAVLLLQEWTLGLVLLAPVVPLIVLCSLFEERYSRAARTSQDRVGDLTTIVEESVLGIRVIKGFGRHRAQEQAFARQSALLRESELRKASLLGRLWGLVTALPELAIGAALVLGVVQVADGGLTAGTLVAFLSTALALRWPVESIGFLLAVTNDAAAATDRFFEVMDAPQAPPDAAPEPAPADGSRTGRATVRDRGLRLAGVEFRYPDAPAAAPPVLRGVDLHIRPGETMALVGTTGCGKTTLTALIPRLHEATAGRITLDGQEITALPRARLRELVSVAFEEPTLFSASAGENVLMGAAGAGEAELRRALAVAQAGFVHSLPDGHRTQVGELGLSLSGGQRQRLALARAVVGGPRYLILDDPLSALDVHTEALVESALREVLATTTALVVAHRPSTVLLADRVALLSGGRITAVGTHHELLHGNGEYASLMSGPERRP
ncbi:ABC transporter ATP-binding protein [Streptomyces griseocarneus]|nr:ABC transporter ATP-binding protein [Streptomyces griseocarneus]